MKKGEQRTAWGIGLAALPKTDRGRREPIEPAASAVVREFLRDVHGLFSEAVNTLRNDGFEASLEPPVVDEVTEESTFVLLVSRPGVAGSFHSLRCERNEGLDMRLVIDLEQSWQEWSSFAIDREPESPLIFIEDSLVRLNDKVREGR